MSIENNEKKIIDLVSNQIINEILQLDISESNSFDLNKLNEKIEDYLKIFPPNDEQKIKEIKLAIAKKVRPHIVLQVKAAPILTDPNNRRDPWYTEDFRNENKNFYWNRFLDLIDSKGDLPRAVKQRLKESSEDIVSQLGNPKHDSYKIKGMVMGNVQSGKTLSYTAVINRAVDAGYKLIILLTGMTESLRSQTQKRVNHDVVGMAYCDVEGSDANQHPIGVGKINKDQRFSSVLTTETTDFNQMHKVGSINFDPYMQPSIMVIKKNVKVLESVNKFLANQGESLSKLPVLLIDDEADNASVDTANKDKDEDPKAINREIRKIIKRCHRISYLAYTATPMANFFIANDPLELEDDENKEQMIDLFPSDFLVSLEPPTNYCGGEWFFLDEEKDEDPIELIEDNESYIPKKHKKDFVVNALPESLTDALGYFMIASAIKDIRRKKGILDDNEKFDTCMVNVSVFSNIQNDLKYIIKDEIEIMEKAIRANGGLKNSNDKILLKLKDIFNEKVNELPDSNEEKLTWELILEQLMRMDKIEVSAANALKVNEDLDWSNEAPKKQVIVGGFMLSRGLTLPGLTVSYYMRNSVMYDTLMQMARWFGYRDGYKDLVKLWLTPLSRENFTIITRALVELTDSIRLMNRNNNMGPRDFGLRVRSHPDLLVTAKTKMRSAMDHTFDLSFAGHHLQTWGFFKDREKEKQKEDLIYSFLAEIKNKMDKDDDHVLFRGISSKIIYDLLDKIKLLIHPTNTHIGEIGYEPNLLMKYLDEYKETKFKDWDVAIFKKSKDKKNNVENINTLLGQEVPYEQRSVRNDTGTLSDCIALSANRGIGSPGTKKVGLKKDQENEDREKPMLIFHFLNARLGKFKNPDDDNLKKYDNNKYIGLGIILPGSKEKNDAIKYKVNQVYWEQHIKPKWEDENEVSNKNEE